MKVAIYTRVSTEDQVKDGYSLDFQRESLEKFANDNQHEIYKIYTDDGYSGYTLERPRLKEMFQDAHKKKFSMVLVWKLDRFSRKQQDLLNLVDELEKCNVAFKSVTEQFDTTTASGKIMFQLLGSFAEFERNRIKERVFPGMMAGVKNGNWQGARFAPYGYRYNKVDQVLEIVPEEEKIVKLIYQMYSAGKSTPQIAGYLYEKNYKTRTGGRFHTKLVGDILNNQIYLGKLVWNANHYDKNQKTLKGYKYVKNDPSQVIIANGKHKSIITQEEYDAVQKILSERRRYILTRRNASDYLLTGVIVCGKCNHNFQGCLSIASRENKKTKEKRRYYRCSGRATHFIKCDNISVRSDDLEDWALRIIEVIANTPFVEEILFEKVEKDLIVEDSQLQRELNAENKKLSLVLSQQKRLLDLNLNGMVADEIFKDKIIDLRDEENNLKKRIMLLNRRMVDAKNSADYHKQVKEFLGCFTDDKNYLTAQIKKLMLKLVFKKIEVLDGKINNFELYEPFKTLYDENKKLWKTKTKQRVVKKTANVSTSALSDDPWLPLRDGLKSLLPGLLLAEPLPKTGASGLSSKIDTKVYTADI